MKGPFRRIPPAVAKRLGYYVYAYVHPVDRRIFYVGKGKGQRVLSHLQDISDSKKAATIQEIRKAGHEPELHVLAHGLGSEETALRVEGAIIDALGLPSLTNRVRGWKAVEFGRAPLDDVIAHYQHRRVRVVHPAILIRINRLYRPMMSPVELYDATRASWKAGVRREGARFALALYDGVVREVYEIQKWLPSGSTFNVRFPQGDKRRDRWEFIGRVAPDSIRRRYINRYVEFGKGAQNPIAYKNVP
jgi:hypothetical protein